LASWRGSLAAGAAGKRESPCRGPLGGAKHGGDEATLPSNTDDRLKAYSVMRIETAATAGRMNRIERVVNVERDPFRDLLERLAIKIDHGAAHAQQDRERRAGSPDGRWSTVNKARGSDGDKSNAILTSDRSQRTGVVSVFVAAAIISSRKRMIQRGCV